VKVTFELGLDGTPPSPDGVWLAGGGNFEVPGGRYRMQDDDEDGIYTITVPRARGFSSFYTFANGNCPDYSCKENLAGLPCGDPNNFNDRFLPPVEDDVTIGTCFGTCSEDALCPTGLSALTPDEGLFTLHGNPAGASGTILVFGNDFTTDRRAYVFNTLGQIVAQWQIGDGQPTFAIPVHTLAEGMYTVTVTSGNHFYSRRFVK
jgi:hypothetical protein